MILFGLTTMVGNRGTGSLVLMPALEREPKVPRAPDWVEPSGRPAPATVSSQVRKMLVGLPGGSAGSRAPARTTAPVTTPRLLPALSVGPVNPVDTQDSA